MNWIINEHLREALADPTRSPFCTMERTMYVLEHPVHTEVQPDGRTRYWGYIEAIDKYLRVVVENDGQTVITVHPDRNFQKKRTS
jgi:hypothetical protein